MPKLFMKGSPAAIRLLSMRTQICRTAALVLACLAPASAQYTIDTYAGSGVADGTPALMAGLAPRAVSVDRSGSVYITGPTGINRLGLDGTVTNFAGSTTGYGGDGGPAASAMLWDPFAVAFDSAGNAYIADTGNGYIRRVDAASGVITTVAGAAYDFTKLGKPGDGGPATDALLVSPYGVAVDPAGKTLYFSDISPGQIRKVDLATGIISTIAGVFSAVRNASPRGLALDGAGSLYVADRGSHRILKVTLATGATTTVVGTTAGFSGDGGTADKAQLQQPRDVAFDSAGNMYIADAGNLLVRKVDATTKVISTFAGTTGTFGSGGDGGDAKAATFSDIGSIAIDPSGAVYVADYYNGRVRQIGLDGKINTIAGGNGGDGGAANQAQIYYPGLLSLNGDGSLLIPDWNRIRMVDSSGTITTVAGNGTPGPAGSGAPMAATDAQFGTYPGGAVADGLGNLLVADTTNSIIRLVILQGNVITTLVGSRANKCKTNTDGVAASAASLCAPVGVALDAARNLYIADFDAAQVFVVTFSTGRLSVFAGTGSSALSGNGGPAVKAAIGAPSCVVAGNDGNIYICDFRNNVIRKVNIASGIISAVAGNGSAGLGADGGLATATKLDGPSALAFDNAGNLLIADSNNNRICSVNAKTGILTTLAGTGDPGFGGDGGDALSGQLNFPDGLAVDTSGNIYVADFYNLRVRVLRPVQAGAADRKEGVKVSHGQAPRRAGRSAGRSRGPGQER